MTDWNLVAKKGWAAVGDVSNWEGIADWIINERIAMFTAAVAEYTRQQGQSAAILATDQPMPPPPPASPRPTPDEPTERE